MPESTQIEDVSDGRRTIVQTWQTRLKQQLTRLEEQDFKRMRKNMEFTAGYQYIGQKSLAGDRYIANLTLSAVNQKVASLYARDPRFVAKQRKRALFEVWDGRVESLQQAIQIASTPDVDPAASQQASMLLEDYTQGRMRRDLIDRIGKTLEIVFEWQKDYQQPAFKTQMKQLVRRAITTGVGYMRVNYIKGAHALMSESDSEVTFKDLIQSARAIQKRIDADEIPADGKEAEVLSQLTESIGFSLDTDETSEIQEYISFDFPTSTSIIVDPRCRSLKGFVGAKWIAQVRLMRLEDVNAFFESDIKAGGTVKTYREDGTELVDTTGDDSDTLRVEESSFVRVYEIFDKTTKSRFFLCEGHPDYLMEPEPVEPVSRGFWPIFALVFNEVETEPGQKASIFPPSDVDLIRPAQLEWNRTRQELRNQREANSPKYMTGKGWLTENDKDKIVEAVPNAVVELEGAKPGDDISKLLSPFRHAPIDPSMYDVAPQMQDISLALNTEEGTRYASSKSTATAASINEQARSVGASSNIDDLDDFLTAVADMCGEVLLRELPVEIVKRIAGPGAVWPDYEREEFADNLFLEIEAASSGRPNKALEISNFAQLAPLLIQAGAPPHFVLREAVKRLDDRLEPDEALPFGEGQATPPMPVGMPPQQPGNIQRPQPSASQGQFPAQTLPQPGGLQ